MTAIASHISGFARFPDMRGVGPDSNSGPLQPKYVISEKSYFNDKLPLSGMDRLPPQKVRVDAMNLGIAALGQLCFAAPVYCAAGFGRRVRQTST